MLVRKKLILSALPIVLAASAAGMQPALAQDPGAQAAIAAGAKVTDSKGGEVGTIAKVDGQFVIVKTDRHEVRLPVTSFTPHNGGLLFGMTRDELNAEVDRTLAAANAKIVAGATVNGSQGGMVGTIDSIDDEFVTVKLASGTKVRLPRSALAPGLNGAVIGMTVAQLEAAAAAAGGEPQAESKPQ